MCNKKKFEDNQAEDRRDNDRDGEARLCGYRLKVIPSGG